MQSHRKQNDLALLKNNHVVPVEPVEGQLP